MYKSLYVRSVNGFVKRMRMKDARHAPEDCLSLLQVGAGLRPELCLSSGAGLEERE